MSYQNLPGWFGVRETYDAFVAAAEPKDTFVEIGVAFGKSLAYLCNGLRERELVGARKARVIAVDTWVADWWGVPAGWTGALPTWGGEFAEWARDQGGPFNAFVRGMVMHAPEALEYADVWRMKSLDAARLVTDYSCRGIMIDGDHSYEAVRRDINAWLPKVRRGGILAGDDYSENFPGLQCAVNEKFGSNFAVVGTTWMVMA